MSSQYHRRRLSILHHLAAGPKTVPQLAAAIGVVSSNVAKLLVHAWFEPVDVTVQPRLWRLSEQGRAADRSAQEGGA